MHSLSIHLSKHEIWSIDTPEVQQRLAAALSNYLKETTNTALADVELRIVAIPRGVPGQTLLRFAGIIAQDDLDHIRRTIETYCNQVDPQ